MQKKFWKKIFSLSRSRSKFLEKSLSKMAVFSSKDKWHLTIWFFTFFKAQTKYFCLKTNSTWKMWSFEVHDVDVAQKMTGWEGRSKATIAAYRPPSPCLSFWARSTWYISKDHIFHVELIFKQKYFFWNWKKWEKSNWKIPIIPPAKNSHFTK